MSLTARSLLLLCLLGASPSALPADEWKLLTPADKSFSAELPGTPSARKSTLKTPVGTVEITTYLLHRDKLAYFLSFSEISEQAAKSESEAKRLQRARDAVVAKLKGKLIAEKKLLLDKAPGCELEIELEGNSSIRTQIFAVRHRVYQLLLAGPTDAINGAESKRFFASFRLGQ